MSAGLLPSQAAADPASLVSELRPAPWLVAASCVSSLGPAARGTQAGLHAWSRRGGIIVSAPHGAAQDGSVSAGCGLAVEGFSARGAVLVPGGSG
jgi:hypothetical protein